MATFALSGSGVQTLSANVTAAHVTITTPSSTQGNGRANPADAYGCALLRFGDATGFFAPVTVAGGPQWLAVPTGATRVGYACLDGAALSLQEVIGGTPPFGGGGSLAGLSDVALASLADAQVLTYQASSSKWINATPTGGGGTSGSVPSCKVFKSAAQSLPNNGYTVLTFDSERWDTDTIHDTVTNNSRLTCHTAGRYLIDFTVEFAANGSGYRQSFMQVNGTALGVSVTTNPTTVGGIITSNPAAQVWPLNVSDYVELVAFQSSGGALNATTGCSFGMTRVGAL
jgi:hypothetical protein